MGVIFKVHLFISFHFFLSIPSCSSPLLPISVLQLCLSLCFCNGKFHIFLISPQCRVQSSLFFHGKYCSGPLVACWLGHDLFELCVDVQCRIAHCAKHKEEGQSLKPGRWHILESETIVFTLSSIKERKELHTNHAYVKLLACAGLYIL